MDWEKRSNNYLSSLLKSLIVALLIAIGLCSCGFEYELADSKFRAEVRIENYSSFVLSFEDGDGKVDFVGLSSCFSLESADSYGESSIYKWGNDSSLCSNLNAE